MEVNKTVELSKKSGGTELTGFPSIDKPWLKYYSEESITTSLPKCSVYEYLYEKNKEYQSDVAINYMGRQISYRELFNNIDEVAKAFINVGVKEKEIVTIALPSIPEALYCVYALNKIGAVANMIHPLSGKDETVRYINEVASRVVVVFDGAYETLCDRLSETTAELIIVASPGDSLPVALKTGYRLKVKKPKLDEIHFLNWKTFLKKSNAVELRTVLKNYKEMALISHTGGTTGEPKGVMCSDYNLNALMFQIVCTFSFERGGCSLVVLPPFINYSLVEATMAMLAIGYKVVLIPKYEPKDFKKYIKKYQPTVILSIPLYWRVLLEDKSKRVDMSCLEHIYYGGEGMSEESETEVNNYLRTCAAKVKLCKGLGSTELTAAATQSFQDCNPIGSVGIPLVKTNCCVVDPDTGKELPYGEQGELCFSGPTLMLGYYKNHEATEEIVKVHSDGQKWLHTGDIGYVNEDGIVYITGRIKRIMATISRDGIVSKLFPDRVEKVICSHPAIEECCVIGVPDAKRINYPKAFVVIKTGFIKDSIEKELIDVCCRELPEYMVPEKIEFIDEMPKTPRGKMDYRKLENVNE